MKAPFPSLKVTFSVSSVWVLCSSSQLSECAVPLVALAVGDVTACALDCASRA